MPEKMPALRVYRTLQCLKQFRRGIAEASLVIHYMEEFVTVLIVGGELVPRVGAIAFLSRIEKLSWSLAGDGDGLLGRRRLDGVEVGDTRTHAPGAD